MDNFPQMIEFRCGKNIVLQTIRTKNSKIFAESLVLPWKTPSV